MIDPLLFAISISSILVGFILGRLMKKEIKIMPPEIPVQIEKAKILFVAVKDEINVAQLIEMTKNETSVFINIRSILRKKEILNYFVQELSLVAKEHRLRVHQVTNELFFLTDSNQPFKVEILPNDENIDDSLQKPVDIVIR